MQGEELDQQHKNIGESVKVAEERSQLRSLEMGPGERLELIVYKNHDHRPHHRLGSQSEDAMRLQEMEIICEVRKIIFGESSG